jgi:hypothetical protein
MRRFSVGILKTFRKVKVGKGKISIDKPLIKRYLIRLVFKNS